MAVDNANQDNLALLFGGLDADTLASLGLGGPAGGGGGSPAMGTRGVMPGGAASTLPAAPGPGPSNVPAATPVPGQRPASPMAGVTLPTPPTAPTMTPIPQMPQTLRDQLVAKQTPVDRSQYKPHWYDRLLAFGLGTAAGYGNAERGERTAANFANRRYLGAEATRQRELAPLLEQRKQYEESLGPLEKQNEESTKSYDVQARNYDQILKAMELNDSRNNATNQRKDAADLLDESRRTTQQRKSEEDQNTPATGARPEQYIDPQSKKPGWRVKTKAGGWMPYSPKSIDEGAMMGDQRATDLYKQAHPGKENAADKKGTRNQFVNVESKRDAAWNKAKSEYDKNVSMLSKSDTKGLERARGDYYEARQQAQNSFEDAVDTLGGQSQHVELSRDHFAEQPTSKGPAAAAPAKTAAGAHKEGDVVRLKGVGPVKITKMHPDGKTFDYVKASSAAGQ